MKGMVRFVIVLTALLLAIASFLTSISAAINGKFLEAIYLILLAGACWLIGEFGVPSSFKKEMR